MSDKIKSIKNIELSSLCNLECEYCLSPLIKNHRKPGLMSFETFEKVAAQIEVFQNNGTQGEIWLHGTGESLLNKDIVKMTRYLIDRMPLAIGLSTNGFLVTDEIISELKEAGLHRLDISCHDFELANLVHAMIIKQGLKSVLNVGPRSKKFNWAGQLDFENETPNRPNCPWIANQQCAVLHDGSIVSCCFDAFGVKVLGHIDDGLDYSIKPYELCENCNHIT